MAHESTTAETAPATNDAFTGMLAVSLIALIAGCALLFLDYSQYTEKAPPSTPKAPPAVVAPQQ